MMAVVDKSYSHGAGSAVGRRFNLASPCASNPYALQARLDERPRCKRGRVGFDGRSSWGVGRSCQLFVVGHPPLHCSTMPGRRRTYAHPRLAAAKWHPCEPRTTPRPPIPQPSHHSPDRSGRFPTAPYISRPCKEACVHDPYCFPPPRACLRDGPAVVHACANRHCARLCVR